MHPTDIISLDYYEMRREPVGRVIYFEATIADIIQVSPVTRWDPAEYAAAACTGDLLLDDSEETPQNFDEFMAYAELVQIWQPIMDRF